MELAILKDGVNTMTSSQFSELTGRSKSSINRTIRDKFVVDSVGCEIASSVSENGMVTDYHLPETESIMLAALLDVEYLRKISEFWKNRNSVTPATFADALQLAADTQRKLQIAIETKAEIGNRREATSMNTASQAVKKSNKLEIELDKSKEYCSIKRMQMICHGQKFNWRMLKTTSAEMDIPSIDIFDSNYGTVKSYHKDVWLESYGLEV